MVTSAREFNAVSFGEFLKEKKLMGIRCRQCGKLSAEARPMCPACHSKEVEWHQFSGKGTLGTFTCVSIVPQRMMEKGYGRNNPYCSGIVILEEGPRISARILGVDASNPQSIQTGMTLVVDFTEAEGKQPALAFRPA